MKTPGYTIICLLWLCAACAGAWGLLKYENSPTAVAETPAQWPSESRITRLPDRPTLLMFAHPHCPCTRASIGELNRMLVQCRGSYAVHVLFIQPKGMTADWTETSLRKSAEAIPGIKVEADLEGAEARRFGAESSGYLVLYSSSGKLLFSGGITASRGHAGDNAGENTIAALLNGVNAQLKHTPVFGCSLQNECPDPSK